MKKKILILSLFLSLTVINFSQILQNGGFELGTTPTNVDQINRATGWSTGCAIQRYWHNGSEITALGTPDLCDRAATGFIDVPFGNAVETRNSPNNRYAHIVGPIEDDPGIRGESIKATVTEAFTSTHQYTISFYTARRRYSSETPRDSRIEIVLRKNTDCNLEKIVYTTANIPQVVVYNSPSNSWNLHTGNFVLSAADVAVGYNRVEFRILGDNDFFGTCIDDASLTKTILPTAAFSFINPKAVVSTASYYGPQPVTELCYPFVAINGAASANESGYYLEVQEFNLNTWSGIGTVLYSGWISGTAQVPSNINIANLVPAGSLQVNKIYKVKLAVGPIWHSVDKFFKLVGCNTASFSFVNPKRVLSLPSYYGPQTVSEMCLPNVYINGAASANEVGYYLEISKINLTNWTGVNYYSNWVPGGTQVPSSINLNSFVPAGTFQPGNVYMVKLATGPVWTDQIKFFSVTNCNSAGIDLSDPGNSNSNNGNGGIITEGNGNGNSSDGTNGNGNGNIGTGEMGQGNLTLYPVPVQNALNVLTDLGSNLRFIRVFDFSNVMLHLLEFPGNSNEGQIDLGGLERGTYVVEVETDLGVERRMIYKE